MLADSTAQEARDVDAERWLAGWLERPHRALGGQRPCELLGTPEGLDAVVRLLGAQASGSYQ